MLGEGLYTLLTTTSAITALVGTSSTRPDKTTGIFPVQMPEATTLPAIVIKQINATGDPIMEGVSGYRHARIQFSCYGRGYADSKRLAAAVRESLEAFYGPLPDGTSVDLAEVLVESDTFAEAPFIYQTPIDFEFAFSEGS